jgi:hypothetical protein
MSDIEKLIVGLIVGWGSVAGLVLFCRWFAPFAQDTWALSAVDARGVTAVVVIGPPTVVVVVFAVVMRIKLKRAGIKTKWRW